MLGRWLTTVPESRVVCRVARTVLQQLARPFLPRVLLLSLCARAVVFRRWAVSREHERWSRLLFALESAGSPPKMSPQNIPRFLQQVASLFWTGFFRCFPRRGNCSSATPEGREETRDRPSRPLDIRSKAQGLRTLTEVNWKTKRMEQGHVT